MINIFRILAILIFLALPFRTIAATISEVQGSWMLDVEASERAILSTLSNKLERFTTSMSVDMWGAMLLKFDGHSLSMMLYGGGRYPTKYEHTSTKDSELTYTFNNVKSQPAEVTQKQGELVVTLLKDGVLSIRFPNDKDSSQYLPQIRWKKAIFDASRTTPNDAKPAMDAWFAALHRIHTAFNQSSSSNSVSGSGPLLNK